MHVVVTRRIPDAGLELLRTAGPGVVAAIDVLQEDEESGVPVGILAARLPEADGVLSLLTETLDRPLLERCPRLRGIANMAVGYDNVDLAAATELGIPVSNTPGVLTDTTADLTFALLLAVARRIPQAHRYTAEGRFRIWGPNLFLGADVSPGGSGRRKVLGIVGDGRIGRAVARRAQGFDMDVVVCGSGRRPPAEGTRAVAFGDLLACSDFVSLHVPLNDSTRHMIGAAELARMRADAYLINTARGPLVDENALVAALRAGVIAGAALDVFEHEPALAPGLADLDNVVILPHIGSASRDTRDAMATMAANNLLAHLRGEPAPNVLNPEVYGTSRYVERIAGHA